MNEHGLFMDLLKKSKFNSNINKKEYIDEYLKGRRPVVREGIKGTDRGKFLYPLWPQLFNVNNVMLGV